MILIACNRLVEDLYNFLFYYFCASCYSNAILLIMAIENI